MEVSDVIEAVDILEYISQFCELEEKQDGEYWGLSPLKEEHTPSFSVNKEKQRFYDFASGKGGNVLDFVCLYNGCDFHKGLEILKKYANIIDDGKSAAPKRLKATSVAKRFRNNKKPEKETKFVVLPDDYMERYEFDRAKLSVWEDEGITQESMRRFEVMYDPFSDRIVYPIRNISGEIINVCGRTLDPEFKEKRLRKYTYFKPLGTLDTIYGLAENRAAIMEKREIILFEGAKSVMIADGWGIKNTAAILTSHLNAYQFKILIKLGVRVVFALDAEIDIREDTNIMRLLHYVPVEWVRNRRGLLLDKDAPVDRGEAVWNELYEGRERLQ